MNSLLQALKQKQCCYHWINRNWVKSLWEWKQAASMHTHKNQNIKHKLFLLQYCQRRYHIKPSTFSLNTRETKKDKVCMAWQWQSSICNSEPVKKTWTDHPIYIIKFRDCTHLSPTRQNLVALSSCQGLLIWVHVHEEQRASLTVKCR